MVSYHKLHILFSSNMFLYHIPVIQKLHVIHIAFTYMWSPKDVEMHFNVVNQFLQLTLHTDLKLKN